MAGVDVVADEVVVDDLVVVVEELEALAAVVVEDAIVAMVGLMAEVEVAARDEMAGGRLATDRKTLRLAGSGPETGLPILSPLILIVSLPPGGEVADLGKKELPVLATL